MRLRPATRAGSACASDFESVGGQQRQEGIVGIGAGALSESKQALLELGELAFGFARGVAAVEAQQRHDQADASASASATKSNTRAKVTLGSEKAKALASRTASTVTIRAAAAVSAAPL